MTCLVTMVNIHGQQTYVIVQFKPDFWNFKEFSIKKVLQDDMEGQEQGADLKHQTYVLSCFDCLGEHTPIGMKLWGLNTTFSAIFTKDNNFCDFLFALTQLAG